MTSLLVPLTFALLTQPQVGQPATAPASAATLTIRIQRPDEQLKQFLSFFEGAKAPDPPTAYARWKRSHPKAMPSKAFEAAFAAFNPEMVRELKTVDGTIVVLTLPPSGGLNWFAALPGDDGTFDALGTALALTDGASLEPFENQPVDRLGPAGAPLMSRGKDGQGAVIAATREGLHDARTLLERFQPTSRPLPGHGEISATLIPSAAGGQTSVPLRRFLEACDAAGCRQLDLQTAVEDEDLQLRITGRFATPPTLAQARIDPGWLLPLPDSEVSAALAFAIDPSPGSWDRTFAWADRVEKSDPARAQLAPLRVRLAVLCAGARFNPESELLPHLRGLTAYLLKSGDDFMASALIGLHLNDPKPAKAFVEVVLPRLTRSTGLGEFLLDADGTLHWPKSRALGDIQVRAIGKTVWIGKGPGGFEALERKADGGKTWAADLIPTGNAPQRLALFKPGSLSNVLPSASRVAWVGQIEGTTSRDEIRWTDLRKVVHSVLDRLLD